MRLDGVGQVRCYHRTARDMSSRLRTTTEKPMKKPAAIAIKKLNLDKQIIRELDKRDPDLLVQVVGGRFKQYTGASNADVCCA